MQAKQKIEYTKKFLRMMCKSFSEEAHQALTERNFTKYEEKRAKCNAMEFCLWFIEEMTNVELDEEILQDFVKSCTK